ncbi:MAG: ammonia-forming cytochrome c nitrite reductase subunit c552 [Lachnospiraceae bacterium]|nr:ammonia-forming cytochrome c nitrite reductase subunit c552 [Lachnospiraceae bacterium]
MADKSLVSKLCISVIAVGILVASAVAETKYSIPGADSAGGASAAAEIQYKEVEAPEAANPNNVVTAEQWAEIYPEICASYEANGENNYRVSYLDEDQDPYLVSIYEGFGFAKDYTSAIAHNYTLADVAETERPHPLANCLTCKTADFTALVNTMGKDAYSLNFEDVMPDMTENVGCYSCHENNAGNKGELTITHDYTLESVGDAGIEPATLVCGQCHIEYYFAPENKATTAPYDSIEAMSPDAILAYYDEMGFSDWTQESTGTGLLKAQHPELETFLGEGSVHASMGLTCASCHMEKTVSEDGVAYTSHSLVSPLASEAILETCASCHQDTDLKAKVEEIQTAVTTREKEIGNDLAAMKEKLAEAVASGAYSEDELNALRDLHRKAQWYFDFEYVENSEGAHNSKLSNSCLDKAADYIAQANALFK